jgi:hypothetical protein
MARIKACLKLHHFWAISNTSTATSSKTKKVLDLYVPRQRQRKSNWETDAEICHEFRQPEMYTRDSKQHLKLNVILKADNESRRQVTLRSVDKAAQGQDFFQVLRSPFKNISPTTI